jgi:hypothetical protein
MLEFKYLGSIITPLLNEDTEIKARIKKAISIVKHYFDCNDVDIRVKYQVYIAGSLNALLWGCECWNATEKNLKKLRTFHHSALRRIHRINWNQV